MGSNYWYSVIGAFSYYLTYNNIKFNWLFLFKILSDCFKIFLVWQVVRYTVIWLDTILPWHKSIAKRLLLQLPATSVTGSASLTVLVLLEYAFVRDYPLEHFYDFDLVIANIFILLANVVYVSLYLYDQALRNQITQKEIESLLQDKNIPSKDYFLVRSGKKEERIAFADILCAYSEDKLTYLLSNQHKTYLLDLSLDQLEKQLPEPLFFRANRKFILTPSVVASVAPDANGKLLVRMQQSPKLPESIGISRLKAPAFRSWLK